MAAMTDRERVETEALKELVKGIRDHRAEGREQAREERADARAHREALLRAIDRMDRLEHRGDEQSDILRRQTPVLETMVETLKAMTLAMNRLSARLE